MRPDTLLFVDPEPSEAPNGAPTAASPAAPTPLRVAAVLVVLEGLAIAVLGALEAFHTTSSRAVMGVTTSLFFVAFGLALVACAWGLSRVSTWARGPVLLAQLIWLGLAWNFRHGDTLPIAIALAVPAVVVLVGMLNSASVEALERGGRADGD